MMNRIHIQLAWSIFLASYADVAISDTDMDVSAGERIYIQCTGCHAPEYHRTGPRHCDLLGRKAGSVADFAFTDAMKNSNLVWNPETLNRFLQAPLTVVPGTSMGFAGIASELERRQLIAFLSTLTTENPRCR
jgi:cytochrome c